jgi:hypothetical protein
MLERCSLVGPLACTSSVEAFSLPSLPPSFTFCQPLALVFRTRHLVSRAPSDRKPRSAVRFCSSSSCALVRSTSSICPSCFLRSSSRGRSTSWEHSRFLLCTRSFPLTTSPPSGSFLQFPCFHQECGECVELATLVQLCRHRHHEIFCSCVSFSRVFEHFLPHVLRGSGLVN